MKHHTHIFLAALTLLAAMSLQSCTKDEPAVPAPVVQTGTQNPPKKAYTLALAGNPPSSFGEGEAVTVTIPLTTNAPDSEVSVINVPDWIKASVSASVVTLDIEANMTYEARTAQPIVCLKDGSCAHRIYITQDWCFSCAEGMVQFKDRNFKKACLEIADTDHDGDISPEEAESIQVIEATGKDIRDISGIGAFRNVWKLDLGNNDIEDAMAVSELHYLHWLNLRGNKNLKCFDVRGCTSYFESCTFEVTPDLDYYLYYRYINIHSTDDTGCKHSHHSQDPRLTQDWSREGEIYEVYHHTEGPGKVALVFSGIGWIDVDVNDGTFERIVHEAIEGLKMQPGWSENWKYFDIYVMVHMAEKRGQWMFSNEKALDMGPDEYALKQAYNEHRKALWKKMENAVQNKYCIKFTVDSHANMKTNFPLVDMGSFVHIIPNSYFDFESEGHPYQYDLVSEIVKRIEFRIGNTGHKNYPLDETTTWTDWLDFD